MNKHIYIYGLVLLLFVTGSTTSLAQSYCEPHGISTNPAEGKHFNPHNPDIVNNYFNWMQEEFEDYFHSGFTPVSYALQNTRNPFWSEFEYMDYLAKEVESDFLPEEGWELIVQGLGKTKDGVEINDFSTVYFLLYNRFSSTLRVLFVLPKEVDDGKYNSLGVTLEFHELPDEEINITGLFEHQDGISNALDTKTDYTSATAIVDATEGLWTHADFTLAYDACTCKFPSSIRLQIKGISKSTVEMTGRFYGSATPLLDANLNIDDAERLISVLA